MATIVTTISLLATVVNLRHILYLVSHISYRPNERPIPSLVFSWQLFQQSYVPRFDNEASFGHNGTGARAGPRTQWI